MWRNIQELGIYTAYSNNATINIIFRVFLDLPFKNPNRLMTAHKLKFVDIIKTGKLEYFKIYKDYVKSNFLGNSDKCTAYNVKFRNAYERVLIYH